MAAVLHVRKGPESGLTFPIPDTAVTLVGRTSSNHIVLSSSSISACHCLIAPDEAGRGFVVIDARSRRGTHVNGRPITRSALRLGDVITIGPYELELAEASPDQPVNAARGERSRRPALFELRRAGSRGRGELLAPGPAKVLGRSRAADVRIGDPYASEYHCLIDLDSTESGVLPFVIDLYTSNKTHVSGRSIHRKHLRPGRTLAIGGAELTVRRLEVPVGRPEPRPAPRPAAPRRRQRVPVLTDADLAEPVPSHPTPVPAPGEDVPILTDRDLAEPPPAPGPAEGDALAPVDELPELPDLDLAESLAPWPAGEPAENAGARRTLEARAAPAEEEPAGPRASLVEPSVAAGAPLAFDVAPEHVAESPPSGGRAGDVGAPPVLEVEPVAAEEGASPPVEVAPAPAPRPGDRAGDAAGPAGRRGSPFQLTADHAFLFASQQHAAALGALEHWLEAGPPVAVLTGERGCGKTLMVASIAHRLAARLPAALVVRPMRGAASADLLVMAAIVQAREALPGLSVAGQAPLERWESLVGQLSRGGHLVAFLLDGADALPRAGGEHLARLLGSDAARAATRILLAGDPGLRDTVPTSPLADHLGPTCHVGPLPGSEVAPYIEHHLRTAEGWHDVQFTDGALEAVQGYSGGVPRLINVAAGAALLLAAREDTRLVDRETVQRAIREALAYEAPPDSS